MRAVVVGEDRAPSVSEFGDPRSGEGLEAVEVRAAALTNLDVMIALGKHYFSPKTLPAVVGREAVVCAQDGLRLYLNVNAIPAPYGSMAERTLADLRFALPVPEGVSDEVAASLGNPGLAAWLPLSWRARMRSGESVLILGATGTTGMMAVAAAVAQGAGRIVAAGRNPAALEAARALGAHETVVLEGDGLAERFRAAVGGDADIVIDYLNGPPAEAALSILGLNGRMVQIGSALAPGIVVPAQLARKNSLDVLGFAYYHAPIEEQRKAYAKICGLAAAGSISPAIEIHSLDQFGTAWERHRSGAGKRMVIVP